ncbi:hypothetical protein [Pseudomonas turukhanskensis]|uniref:hypothetical protein n=1 Tax=Pseudomonas turukhanskensis TaxID=1806536 RepID=UPI0022F2BBC4|nr:hypothetical protein [Pseudomonas turukhanskensis]
MVDKFVAMAALSFITYHLAHWRIERTALMGKIQSLLMKKIRFHQGNAACLRLSHPHVH